MRYNALSKHAEDANVYRTYTESGITGIGFEHLKLD
jgi:hypothetical protein